MRWFSKARDGDKLLDFAFCEYGNSIMGFCHIRRLTEAGPKYGGGADTKALCGREVRWDLDTPITEERLIHPGHVCQECAALYRQEVKG